MNSVIETIKKRQSTRAYRSEQIKDEELKLIIEAGIEAPSGHNDQSWFFTVIQNKELINELSQKTKEYMKTSGLDFAEKLGNNENFHVFYNAPTIIVVSARENAVSPMADTCAAIQNMLLAAESLDIGSCWIGFTGMFFRRGGKIEGINFKDGYNSYYTICLGYKDETKVLNKPSRNKDVVEYIR